MNLLSLIAVAALNSSVASLEPASVQLPSDTLYSDASYPYNMLVNRADALKIIYTVNKQQVTCSVLLEDNRLNEESSVMRVNKLDFDEDPLASCLARDQAKQWLSKTF